ncbi:glycoside hydrolase family 3 protein [Babjeviella inositovora NRRL Y-12698]|uniref:beta-glucosidase n=1 Tax=Babjeviella inositovora NRRL Y-12698 TaxID=984486 RepID=A0A1E3R094_9ASCO|nr:glycoside hydrolase family 3 protein [Babjeviella inositovora NRRL Y-12698]ODQ82782.1 glycoside hydrolase family 3 protein [Babjeviella inositovora NRRL Y-12698]
MPLDIEHVISQLTLREKVELVSGIDFWHTKAVERLNIPSLRFSDGPNGIRGTKFFNGVKSGCFPCGTSLGSTFDKELLEAAGRLMATEAKFKGAHVILGPTCNIQRSPLGGRGFESFSEDPSLSGLATAAVIKGIQSEGIVATIKHFVANDLEDERNSINAIISQRALREVYLKPFQIAVRDAEPKALMTCYNKVNGEHVSQSKYLLTDILRNEWQWDGTIMSDWFGVYSIKASIDAGLDIEMPGPPLMRNVAGLIHAITTTEIHSDVIDDRVRNVLKLVNNCANANVSDGETDGNNTKETGQKLNAIGCAGVVLLKNENNFLPLLKTDNVAVIGPNAKIARYCGGGSASMVTYYAITPYEGIERKLDAKPAYAIGTSIHKTLPGLGSHLVSPDGAVGYTTNVYLEPREAKNRTYVETIAMSDSSFHLFDYKHPKISGNLFYFDLEGTYTPEETGEYDFGVACLGTAELFIDGKLVVDNRTSQTPGPTGLGSGAAEKISTVALTKGQKYTVKIYFGSAPTCKVKSADTVSTNGGGSLSFGAIKKSSPEENIAAAVKVAKANDKVVLCIGTSKDWESEGVDRPDMDLPRNQEELVLRVLEANPNTVIVNQSGTPVTLSAEVVAKTPALLQAWFGGNETGNVIANILFGDVNPSGKLPLTWPKKLEDNPAHLTYKSDRGQCVYGEDVYVGYKWYEKNKIEPLFAFGHGLSYTSFKLSDLGVQRDAKTFTVSVTVTNTGDRDGAEVVQVYLAPPTSYDIQAISRPNKELKDFAKVFVKAGASKRVEITLDLKYATSFFDAYKNKWCSVKGEYTVLVGNSSDNISLEGTVKVDKTVFWSGV